MRQMPHDSAALSPQEADLIFPTVNEVHPNVSWEERLINEVPSLRNDENNS